MLGIVVTSFVTGALAIMILDFRSRRHPRLDMGRHAARFRFHHGFELPPFAKVDPSLLNMVPFLAEARTSAT